ncbi:CRISPR-associated helicase Cas3' [Aerococcaceae bacterium DSM 111020]|nr:CRISPR-associated helicase Cas3' [Aerococcaceae bacterium DSM 111020]
MENYQDYLWAKKSDKYSVFKWLPLKQHLHDVTQVIIQLWNHWLSESQKKIIMQGINTHSEEAGLQVAIFIAAIHDIGKATPAFQFKKGFNNSLDLDIVLKGKLTANGFADINDTPLPNSNKSHHAIAGQFILEKNDVPHSIASIIGAHHGQPVNSQRDLKIQRSYVSNYYQKESPTDPSHILWKKVQADILDWAMMIADYRSKDEIPHASLDAQVILSGLLIMADWIGSNEHYFPLTDLENSIIDLTENRIQNAWGLWKKSDIWIANQETDINTLYEKRFGFSANDVQLKLAELIQKANQPGLYILESVMGSGKTEAALAGAELLAAKFELSGVYFGLPTQATSNGIFPRLEDWVNKIVDESQENKSIQLVHGKAALNPEYSKIRQRGKSGETLEESVIVNEWFAGRKTATLDDFVVGTVDQLLMMSLRSKHLMLRHLGFSRKVVIIDEVHAYDAFMNGYLERSLQWLGFYKVPVILLSATLPKSTRLKFVEAYLTGFTGEKASESNLSMVNSENYPLITYTDGNELNQFSDFEKVKNKDISLFSLNDEQLISLIKQKLSNGGIVGCIVNTVRRSQYLATELMKIFDKAEVELLHSGFIATERAYKESELIKSIGKDGNRPFRKIIVGTQVIEQSLDIDFDLLVTDLAPMDLLIQRIGRLHRHENTLRPSLLKEPQVYILGMSGTLEFDSGTSAVYGDYLLIRTQELLSDRISIPADISPLVQATYSDVPIDRISDNHPKYQDAFEKHYQLNKKKESSSNQYKLKKAPNSQKRNRDSLTGWLKNMKDNQSEEHGIATVRDATDSIEVIVLQEDIDDYKLLNGTKNLKKKISQTNIQMEIAQQTIRLPNILCHVSKIDQTIKELEMLRKTRLVEWNESHWLKGALAIILDEKMSCHLNGYILKYDNHLGLTYEKEE